MYKACAVAFVIALGLLGCWGKLANDDFANATVISQLPFQEDFNDTLATVEPEEPLEGNNINFTLWWSFESDRSGIVLIQILDNCAAYFKVFGLKNESDVDLLQLVEIKSERIVPVPVAEGESFANSWGQTFPVSENQKVFVRSSTIDSTCDKRIKMSFGEVPVNVKSENATVIQDFPVNVTGDIFEFTPLVGSLWWTIFINDSTTLRLDCTGSTFHFNLIDPHTGDDLDQCLTGFNIMEHVVHDGHYFISAFTYADDYISLTTPVKFNMELIPPPANQNPLTPVEIVELPFETHYDSLYCTTEEKSLYWSYHSSFDGFLALDGSSNIKFEGTAESWFSTKILQVEEGRDITIFLQFDTSLHFRDRGSFSLFQVELPSNRRRHSATVINSFPFVQNFSTQYSSSEDDAFTGQYLWWTISKTEEKLLIRVSCSSQTEYSFVQVQTSTGDPVDFVGSSLSDFSHEFYQEFPAIPGETYFIAAGLRGFGSSDGASFVLNVTSSILPKNELPEVADVIASIPFVATNLLTTYVPSTLIFYDIHAPEKALWWSLKPNSTESLFLTTEGSDFDTGMSVFFQENDLIKLISSNDDCSTGHLFSCITLDAKSDVTYLIAIGSFNNESLSGSMNFEIRNTIIGESKSKRNKSAIALKVVVPILSILILVAGVFGYLIGKRHSLKNSLYAPIQSPE